MNIIAVAIMGTFYLAPTFMELHERGIRNPWEKPEQCNYFNSELQKTLLLLMAKNNDQQAIDLDKDTLLLIAKNNYDLYCNELLNSKVREKSFEEYWNHQLNNWDFRISQCCGQKINVNDFHFITLSHKGREQCYWAMSNTVQLHNPGSTESYDELLQLPLPLRSKIGNLCIVQSARPNWLTTWEVKIEPLVPEKHAEALALKKQTEQEFQRLKKHSIKHQQKASYKLLIQE